MKCKACGFDDTNPPAPKYPGSEPTAFIRVNGYFTISTPRDYGPDMVDEIDLYACPMCGTLRLRSGWPCYQINE